MQSQAGCSAQEFRNAGRLSGMRVGLIEAGMG
jgi:hypothetical protein